MDQQQCIFCGIANGNVPSKKVFEDDKVTVVLDIYPANPAHLLVLTKNHYSIFNQLSKEEAEHLAIISKRISELMFKVLKPEGINFFIANGPIAGQKAPHFILHAIPRFSGDGLNLEVPVTQIDEKELSAMYENMKGTLKNYFPDVDFDSVPQVEEEPKVEEEKEEKTETPAPEKEPEDKPPAEEKKKEPKQESTEKETQPKKDDDVDLDKITEMFS